MKTVTLYNSVYQCFVGSNAKENWQLLSESVLTDILFHLHSFPSCYVILKNENEAFPEMDIIKEAAIICKTNTKYKNLKDIKVDYTFCRNIEKGEKVGELIYKSNKKVLCIIP
jgi:predicted ribosome quality control (RQC) complex YloA/Tae2 family protein